MLNNSYTIYIEKKFNKYLNGLPTDIKRIFDKKMEYFRDNPSHPSLNTKPFSVSKKTLKRLGVDKVYEFYINRKDYRCIFYVINKSKEIIIAYVGNHTQIKNKYS